MALSFRDRQGIVAEARPPERTAGSHGAADAIRNPVTGQPHVVSVKLPKGFEYSEAEFLRGTAKSSGPIELHFEGTHAHVAKVHWSTYGVVR